MCSQPFLVLKTTTYIVETPNANAAEVKARIEAHPRMLKKESKTVDFYKFNGTHIHKNKTGARYQISDPQPTCFYYYFGTFPQCHTNIEDVTDRFGAYEELTFYPAQNWKIDGESELVQKNRRIEELETDLDAQHTALLEAEYQLKAITKRCKKLESDNNYWKSCYFYEQRHNNSRRTRHFNMEEPLNLLAKLPKKKVIRKCNFTPSQVTNYEKKGFKFYAGGQTYNGF